MSLLMCGHLHTHVHTIKRKRPTFLIMANCNRFTRKYFATINCDMFKRMPRFKIIKRFYQKKKKEYLWLSKKIRVLSLVLVLGHLKPAITLSPPLASGDICTHSYTHTHTKIKTNLLKKNPKIENSRNPHSKQVQIIEFAISHKKEISKSLISREALPISLIALYLCSIMYA